MKTQTRQHGFTLMELIVALAVVSIMVIGFGTILTTTQKLVSDSQKMMRANSSAASIARVIRSDLRKVSKNGFLAYYYEDDTSSVTGSGILDEDDKFFLVTTTAGVSPSVTLPDIGSGTINIYGRHENAINSQNELLLRQRWVLKSNPSNTFASGYDCWDTDFSVIQTLPLGINQAMDYDSAGNNINNIQELVAFLMGHTNLPTFEGYSVTLNYPPQNITDIRKLWQILSPYCEGLIIQWWDSSATGDYNSTGGPGWSSVPAIWGKDEGWYLSGMSYVQGPGEWPKMFRILIKMSDEAIESNIAENSGNVFEIIVTVGQ